MCSTSVDSRVKGKVSVDSEPACTVSATSGARYRIDVQNVYNYQAYVCADIGTRADQRGHLRFNNQSDLFKLRLPVAPRGPFKQEIQLSPGDSASAPTQVAIGLKWDLAPRARDPRGDHTKIDDVDFAVTVG